MPPSNRITLYYRADLAMPEGKLAAQCAHALMRLCLKLFQWQGPHRLVMSGVNLPHYLAWRADPQISLVPVMDEAALLDIHHSVDFPCALVTDRGLTVFNGQPTHTVVAVWDNPNVVLYDNDGLLPQVDPDAPEQKTKQVLVCDKRLKPYPEEMAARCAYVAWLALESVMRFMPEAVELRLTEPALQHWLYGRFTKVVLRTKSGKLSAFVQGLPATVRLAVSAEQGEPWVIAFMPAREAYINHYTARLSLF